MLMVIFGAGASYDSYSVIPPPAVDPDRPLPDGYRHHFGEYLPYRPPLTVELFSRKSFVDEVLGEYRELQRHLAVLRDPPSGSVEQEFEHLRDQSEHEALLALRFYLQLLFSHVVREWLQQIKGGAATNHAALLHRIKNATKGGEDVLLVTFNYDTMLEAALASQDMVTIKGIPDYLTTNYKVIKLHGSVNWVHPVRSTVDTRNGTKETARNLIRMAPELDIDNDNFVFLRPETNFLDHPGGLLLTDAREVNVPAIAVPIVTKKNYECPKDHLRLLETSISDVTKLLLIGWRAGEEHFLSMLRGLNNDTRIMIVSSGPNGAGQVREKLLSAEIPNASISLSDKGFTGFLGSYVPDEFLRS